MLLDGVRWHAVQVALLVDLATAVGCTEVVTFPDGSIPDVARLNRRRSLFLLGDAKDTETPGNAATQDRLLTYLRWLAAYAANPEAISVLAVCFRRPADAVPWMRHITSLAQIACGGDINDATATHFGPGLCVLRCTVRLTPIGRLESTTTGTSLRWQ